MARIIKIISVSLFILIFFAACGEEEERDRVTWMQVYFTVDLLLDNNLENSGSSKIFTKSNLVNATDRIESPGIVVYNNGDPLGLGIPFVAYDIRCPKENRLDATIKVNGAEAICSVCGTHYDLILGNTIKGSGGKRLQDYSVNRLGSNSKKLIIRNR